MVNWKEVQEEEGEKKRKEGDEGGRQVRTGRGIKGGNGGGREGGREKTIKEVGDGWERQEGEGKEDGGNQVGVEGGCGPEGAGAASPSREHQSSPPW